MGDDALTFRGALRILGAGDRRGLDRLNLLLGGTLLGAGAVAAGVPGLAVTAPLWGWIDQKNEAVLLLRTGLDRAASQLSRGEVTGRGRRDLIAAAHTAIVVAAYFDALQEVLGSEAYGRLEITAAEKARLGADSEVRGRVDQATGWLYDNGVPAPTASRGFEETVPKVDEWLFLLAGSVATFVDGLAVRVPMMPIVDAAEQATERYRSHYLKLAATVPEFRVWALLTEAAATRTAVGALGMALESDRRALARVEALLRVPARVADLPDPMLVLRRANAAVLQQQVVDQDRARHPDGITLPQVGQLYVNPRCRVAEADSKSQLSRRDWWEARPQRDDLDLMLAAHLLSPAATRMPLLLLGDPGAGKSMLTKVLAARLPPSDYTVVRVPLRSVSADLPVIRQVQEALDLRTNGRVKWLRLSEVSADTTRVVVLDGLDELLQASTSNRSGYLHAIMEFQRIEAEQDRPVAVLVTSRTVVSDRIDVPFGTTVVHLDEFTDDQVAEWLERWREANRPAVDSGTVRALTTDALARHKQLMRQPLLLLLLALYVADPASPDLTADLTTTGLYERLLADFARREVRKAPAPPTAGELDRQVDEQLERLSYAAFAMFNRGRQDVTEAELGRDLVALTGVEAEDLGERLIGEFYFVHAAEAGPPAGSARRPERSYEFLHATFGEYLVARMAVDVVQELARGASGRRGRAEPDDDLLFALLSHQPLAGRQTALVFARELLDDLSEGERIAVRRALETLVRSFRHRHGTDRYAAYRPVPVDRVREAAAYSANLVLLRAALDDPVRLADLGADPAAWTALVTLWRSALDPAGYEAMLDSLWLSGDGVHLGSEEAWNLTDPDVRFSRLTGDRALETRLRYGLAIRDGETYGLETLDPDGWREEMESWLISATAPSPLAHALRNWRVPDAPEGTSEADRRHIANMLLRAVVVRSGSGGLHEFVARQVIALTAAPDPYLLATCVANHPTLLIEVPELTDARWYRGATGVPLLLRAAYRPNLPIEYERLLAVLGDEGLAGVRGLLIGLNVLHLFRQPAPRDPDDEE